eukprot:3150971-Pleurochrysis_carterae.AAC.1
MEGRSGMEGRRAEAPARPAGPDTKEQGFAHQQEATSKRGYLQVAAEGNDSPHESHFEASNPDHPTCDLTKLHIKSDETATACGDACEGDEYSCRVGEHGARSSLSSTVSCSLASLGRSAKPGHASSKNKSSRPSAEDVRSGKDKAVKPDMSCSLPSQAPCRNRAKDVSPSSRQRMSTQRPSPKPITTMTAKCRDT